MRDDAKLWRKYFFDVLHNEKFISRSFDELRLTTSGRVFAKRDRTAGSAKAHILSTAQLSNVRSIGTITCAHAAQVMV